VREALQTRLLNWHVDTSGVPAQSRDARDMPAYIPDEPFADKEAQIDELGRAFDTRCRLDPGDPAVVAGWTACCIPFPAAAYLVIGSGSLDLSF
jgi:hypothetical protein